MEGIREGFEAYKKGTESAGNGLPLGEKTSIQFMSFCAKTMEEAINVARPGINDLYGNIEAHMGRVRQGLLGANETLTNDDLNCDWFDFLWKHNVIMIGTPDHLAEQLDRLNREINFQHFQIFPSIPFISFEQYMKSIELFGTEVVPRFSDNNGK